MPTRVMTNRVTLRIDSLQYFASTNIDAITCAGIDNGNGKTNDRNRFILIIISHPVKIFFLDMLFCILVVIIRNIQRIFVYIYSPLFFFISLVRKPTIKELMLQAYQKHVKIILFVLNGSYLIVAKMQRKPSV